MVVCDWGYGVLYFGKVNRFSGVWFGIAINI